MLFLATPVWADGKATPWQIWHQEAATPVMERVIQMHGMLLWVLTAILALVTGLLAFVVIRFHEKKNPVPSKRSHNVPLEIVWTLIPTLIIAIIAFPSIKLIYFMDKVQEADVTLKITGHQWYWEYEYPDHNITFNSYMLTPDKLQPGQLRNLEVDKQVVLPTNTNVRVLVTSADVLHSWSVPAFGVKKDTVPGKLQETWVNIKKPGVYYGQCSELCGQGHGFMSIAVKAVPKADYLMWVKEQGGVDPLKPQKIVKDK
jgi:cytochrome c oxidase subunit 2